MTALEELLKKILRNPHDFIYYSSGLTLRAYQAEPAQAIIDSVLGKQGGNFVIIFPRQSGKNEIQAQIQAYLLTVFSKREAEMVSISPTWKPQSFNAMARLERVLAANLITRDLWSKQRDYVYRVGGARCYFLSGSPTTNIVGATANTLLSIDEAQDIRIDKFDKEIAPMAASTNATRVFWGTAWTSNTLLAREEKTAAAQQQKDGIRRVWRLTCDQVAAEIPPYGDFVADQVAKLGRNHPLVKTQYYSEDIDAEGGLFPPSRLIQIRGVHPPQLVPASGQIYVMALDVAGEDEESKDTLTFATGARDATALTLARVNLDGLRDPGLLLPAYEIVYRQQWVGVKHTMLYAQILNLARVWNVKYLVCDATGVGAGLTSFLAKPLGEKVIPFVFNASTKSKLGWAFLALVDTGRLADYATPQGDPSTLAQLSTAFFQQLEYCQYEIIPGPEKRLAWAVPDGTRDPASGDRIHDDLLLSAALLSCLDDKPWAFSQPSAIIQAPDPLDDMKGF